MPAPVRVGSWTYHGVPQGLSPDVHDISADEGGNVYVAAGDAVYARARAADQFLRFDSENAGLSKKCNDASEISNPVPPKPMVMCPILSVAGASSGKALIGFWGFGVEADTGQTWALDTGGMDVVAFDPVAGKMTKTRHVLTGAPPHVVCDYGHTQWLDLPCVPRVGDTIIPPPLPWWDFGRRLFRKIDRIAVNHDPNSALYGDVWMGGGHGTLGALLNNTAARNWKDTTLGLDGSDPSWADAKDVWEHLHPIVVATRADGILVENYGEGYAISIDPRNGMPWASNGYRTISVGGYSADLTYRNWGMFPTIDIWPDGTDPYPIFDAADDFVRSLTHCQDGTLWAGSITHGLARIDTSGAISYVPLPNGDGAQTVACDWKDGSLWVGPWSGGLLRWNGTTFQKIEVAGAPAFAGQQVQNIQFDRWSSGGRVVYFAFGAAKDSTGAITAPGGVAAYDGP